jgi:hypothetical protein
MGDPTMTNEIPDTADAMEAKATYDQLPVGWLVLFFGLIAWGAWYLWAYSPWGAGWTQAGQLDGAQAGGASVETNVFMTVLFTVIPTAAAAGLYLMQRRARKG